MILKMESSDTTLKNVGSCLPFRRRVQAPSRPSLLSTRGRLPAHSPTPPFLPPSLGRIQSMGIHYSHLHMAGRSVTTHIVLIKKHIILRKNVISMFKKVKNKIKIFNRVRRTHWELKKLQNKLHNRNKDVSDKQLKR